MMNTHRISSLRALKRIFQGVAISYIFFIIVLFPAFAFADSWIQTDWSGGDGFMQWQNAAGYYNDYGVNGWRKPGSLTLFAPDFGHFKSIGKVQNEVGVYSIHSDSLNRYYAGVGSNTSGSARLCISTNFGNTWQYSLVDSTSCKKVTSIFLPSFCEEIFVGTEPSKVYMSKSYGDSGWTFMGGLSGNYVSSMLETDDQYLYASTVFSSNNNGKVWYSEYQGTGWIPFSRQPNIGGVFPAAIYQLIVTETQMIDYDFFAASYYTNYGARIFRFLSPTGNWELCGNLPDTSCIPFAMDIGCDTLGNYGVIYVGTGDVYGKVFRSTDKGDSWNTCGTLAGAWSVYEIKVDIDGTIYAACKLYEKNKRGFAVKIFCSSDMGLTWNQSSAIGGVLTNKPSSLHITDTGTLLLGTQNEAEIFKAAYVDSGFLSSSIYDVGTGNGSSEFGFLSWVFNLNGQQLGVKVRTDTDSLMSNAVSWTQCPNAVNGEDISQLFSVNDGDRYIQYRVKLSTDSIDYSSELDEIQIDYTIDSFPPILDCAYASDGSNVLPGIDDDDYVILIFDDSTNMPIISSDNIDSVLILSSVHTWLDGHYYTCAEWVSPETLKISWPGLFGCPTVDVGDTIYPDTLTITDRWGNPCCNPMVLTGSFGPSGVCEKSLSSRLTEAVSVNPTISRWGTKISFNLSADAYVKVNLFDIAGRKLETIADKKLSRDTHSLSWHNKSLPQGLYFIRIDIEGKSYIRKISLIK